MIGPSRTTTLGDTRLARMLSRLYGGGGRQALVIGSVCLVFLLLVALNMVRHVPQMPEPKGDTPDYLTIAAHRPPLYGWLLAVYRGLFGSLRLLPWLQLVFIASGLLVFATELALLLGSALAGVAAIILVIAHVQIHDSPAWILSEPLFLGLIMAGLGLQFRAVRLGGIRSLLLAMLCFGLATDTRTTGTIFLLMPVLCALFDRRRTLREAIARAAMTAALAALLLGMAMGGNWVRHGTFAMGTATGESLLGKAIITLRASDLPLLPPAIAPLVAEAEIGRRAVAAQPDLGARLRTEVQAGWDLKYTGFYNNAERTWPLFRDGDRQHKNYLMKDIADRLIRAHPREYLSLVGDSWLGLLLYPAYWPNWAGASTTDKAGATSCQRVHRCWAQARYDVGNVRFLLMVGVAIAAAFASALVILGGSIRVLRRRASTELVGLWSLSVVLNGTLFATAITEEPLERYTVALHVMGVALLVWLAARALARLPLPHYARPIAVRVRGR